MPMEEKPVEKDSNVNNYADCIIVNTVTPKKIVADYSSSSGTDDESTGSSLSSSVSESDNDCEDIEDLIKPMEEIKIQVSADKCQEVGKVKSVVGKKVVVEPNVGLAALDLDTILFLDQGSSVLGRVDDVFGPVTEPLYAVIFPSEEAVTKKGITAGRLVYYAPATDHTSYVFLPDLLKMKGSDASWKHNKEPPPDLQDFSDDEEEAKASSNEKGKASVPPGRGRERYRSSRNHRSPRGRGRGPGPPPSWMPPMFNMPFYPPQSNLPFNYNVQPPMAQEFQFMPPMPPPPFNTHRFVPPQSGYPHPPGYYPGPGVMFPQPGPGPSNIHRWPRP